MALTGHLSDLSLSELIEFFCNQRKTGQLKVFYPQGHGYFYLQSGSVVDASIGTLRGIDAVYYALTLANASFEFGGSFESTERTINQPWTQVVLEGLRRLDEGIVPLSAFPADYEGEKKPEAPTPQDLSFTELENLRVPPFLSFINKESMGNRNALVAGAVAVAVLASVAVIGFPAGWYDRARTSVVASESASQPAGPGSTSAAPGAATVAELPKSELVEPSGPSEFTDHNDEAAFAAKRQRDKEKAKARVEKVATLKEEALLPSSPAPTKVVSDSAKPSLKKVAVTVTYDESGRVTQASGGDASAVRIARQKRFPAGKAGSATVTIPINK
jgi:hypothetical protein